MRFGLALPLVLATGCGERSPPYEAPIATTAPGPAPAPRTPTVSDVRVTPTHARPGDRLTCSYAFSGETDRSPVRWLVGGVEVGTGLELDTTGLAVGIDVACQVTPSDGVATGPVVEATATLPGNYLIFVADDLGIDRLPVYEVGENWPETPRIDQLASQGVRFTRAWAQGLCSPGRAAIQTGRQPYQTGIGHALDYANDNPLADTEVTLAEMLTGGTAGLYATSFVGKWHLSSTRLGAEAFYAHPNTQGWQYFAGLMAGLDVYEFDERKKNYYNWEKVVDGKPEGADTYVTLDNGIEAVKRIEAMPEPWILMVAFLAPHEPRDPPPPDLTSGQKVGDSTAQRAENAMIEALDNQLGVVLDAMGPELQARTTVVFTADNGTQKEAISAPYDEENSKATPFEGGIRVPLIVSGLHVSRVGEVSDHLVHVTDLFATFRDLSRVTDDGVARDSVPFSAALADPSAPPARQIVFSESFDPEGPPPHDQHWISIRDDRWKLIRTTLLGDFFYDLGHAPVEGDDLLAVGLTPEQQAGYDALLAAVPVAFP